MSLFFINNFRTFTIIDKNTNEIIYTDVKSPYRETLREDIIQSRNYLAALAGGKGDKEN